MLGIEKDFCVDVAKEVIKIYEDVYPELEQNKQFIFDELKEEEKKLEKPMDKLNQYKIDLLAAVESGAIKKIHDAPILSAPKVASGEYIFENYQSYGVPPDLSKNIVVELGIKLDEAGYEKASKKHQDLSRTAAAGKFKSGLADNSKQTTKYHTAAHLLVAALRKVLGNDVTQKGSNITSERVRFDFNFARKLTPEEIKEVENLVNEQIKAGLPINCCEMETKEALKSGAMGVFGHKYPEKVKVYSVGLDFSKEICAGPHVENTNELGVFKIVKEESSSQGVRRIKAILQ